MKKRNEIFKVSKTYQCVTPESAEHGDFSDQGYEWQDKDYSLRELLYEIKSQGNEYAQLNNDNYADIYGWNYTSDYKTGEDTTPCLHVSGSSRAMNRLMKIIEVKS
jgi:hypothetical protein